MSSSHRQESMREHSRSHSSRVSPPSTDRHRSQERSTHDDEPLFSRVHVTYPKDATRHELRMAFCKYGSIQDIWIIKDRETFKEKGVAYIKYSKASEAAKASEELHGKPLNENFKKPLQVYVSVPRKDITRDYVPDDKVYETMLRLFITFDKKMSKSDLRTIFDRYGRVTRIFIICDKETSLSKGIGYVTFEKASEAAKALEECSRRFNAQFAFVRTDNSTDRRSTERRSPDRRSIDRRSPSPHYHSRSSERRTNRSSNNHVKHESHVINERSDHVKHEPKSYSGFDSNVETWNDTNQIVNILKNENDYISDRRSNENNYRPYKSPLSKDSAEKFCVQITDNKNDRKVLLVDDHSKNGNKGVLNEILKKADEDSPVLLVKSRINENLLRKILDLIPGMVEFSLYSAGYSNKKYQYLVKFENKFISAYVVTKLNGFEISQGERIDIEYFDSSSNFEAENELNTSLGEEIIKDIINSNPDVYSQTSQNSPGAICSYEPPHSSPDDDLLARNHNQLLKNYQNEKRKHNDKSTNDKDDIIIPSDSKSEQQQDPVQQTLSLILYSSILNQLQAQPQLQQQQQKPDRIDSNGGDNRSLPMENSEHRNGNNKSLNSNKKNITVQIGCRHEINKDLLYVIMSQFNNLIDVNLNDDKKSGYANFSNDFDALLAINTINNREIANNLFTAKIVDSSKIRSSTSSSSEMSRNTSRNSKEKEYDRLPSYYMSQPPQTALLPTPPTSSSSSYGRQRFNSPPYQPQSSLYVQNSHSHHSPPSHSNSHLQQSSYTSSYAPPPSSSSYDNGNNYYQYRDGRSDEGKSSKRPVSTEWPDQLHHSSSNSSTRSKRTRDQY